MRLQESPVFCVRCDTESLLLLVARLKLDLRSTSRIVERHAAVSARFYGAAVANDRIANDAAGTRGRSETAFAGHKNSLRTCTTRRNVLNSHFSRAKCLIGAGNLYLNGFSVIVNKRTSGPGCNMSLITRRGLNPAASAFHSRHAESGERIEWSLRGESVRTDCGAGSCISDQRGMFT